MGTEWIEVDGAVAEAITRLLRLEPRLRELGSWDARISVAGASVKVSATQPIYPLRAD